MKLKKVLIYVMLLAVALMAVGCMRNAGEVDNSNVSPTAAPTMRPAVGTTAGAGASGVPAFDWSADANQIENNINQISEISESRVLVNGNTAIVAVKFSATYEGELTQRIREMVAAEVMEADPNIETVAVTVEEDDVNELFSLSDQVKAGTKKLDDLGPDIDRIVSNATTLK